MVATQLTSEIVTMPQAMESRFGEISYDLLNPKGGKPLLQVNRINSRSTEYAHIEVISPANIRYTPKDDSISVMLRPSVTTGLGPFVSSREKLLGIATCSHQSPFWSTELGGTELHCLTIRRSLLAKHAFDIVDTRVLENTEVLTLDAQRAKLVLDKIQQIIHTTESTQALDIRLTHVVLSMCEIAHHEAEWKRKHESLQIIWKHLRDEDPHTLNSETLLEKTRLSDHQLNHLFKRQTGLSARQFISSYKLNRIRHDLHHTGRRYSECVADYGYQSPDQLYRAYLKLFAEEPPLNTH